jgi:MFS family permease
MLPNLMTPARLVMAVFFMQAAVFANWLQRIPDIQAKLGVGPGGLSIALLGGPLASLAALAVVGAAVERLTPRLTIFYAFCAYSFAILLPGWAWDVPSLFVALFLLGLVYPVVDVAMNVEANRIERSLGRRIMSTCHGFWSIGTAAGALVGAGFAEFGIDTRWHLLAIGVVALAFSLTVPRKLPVLERQAASDLLRRRVFTLPTPGMLGVCFFAFGMILVEMGTRNWSAIFLRDTLAGSPAAAGIGYGAFAFAMAVGRFLGDRLTDRWGPTTLARICTCIAIAGVAAVVAAIGVPMGILGFALAGLGVSIAYPLAVTAVAGRGDRPAALNVAAFSLFTSSSALIAPPLIGFVADAGGMRVGLAMLLPSLAVSLLLTGELGQHARRAGAIPHAGVER